MATSMELSNSQLDEDSGTDMSDLDVDGLGESGPRKKIEKAKWTENEVLFNHLFHLYSCVMYNFVTH